MQFHDICEFDGQTLEFVRFKQEALDLPGFDFLGDKMVFVTDHKFKVGEKDYECKSFKIDTAIPEVVKPHLENYVESRTSFFQVVKYVLAVANINNIKYFKSFGIRAMLVIPEGTDTSKLTPEEMDKLERRPVIIMHGCPEEVEQTVVPTEEVPK